MNMALSSSRSASFDKEPRQVSSPQDPNLRWLDTRWGVWMLQPGLTSICVAVQSMSRVYLSRASNVWAASVGDPARFPAGMRRAECPVDHKSTEIRRALRSSPRDSTVPTSMTPARIVSAFMGEPPCVVYRLSLNTPETPGPRLRGKGPGFPAQVIPALRLPFCGAAPAEACEPRVLLRFRRRAWFPAHR